MRRMILRIFCAFCLTYIHRHFRLFSEKVCAKSKTVVLPTLIGGGMINAQNAQVFFYIYIGKIKYFNAASLSSLVFFYFLFFMRDTEKNMRILRICLKTPMVTRKKMRKTCAKCAECAESFFRKRNNANCLMFRHPKRILDIAA